jgi:hypothetical protein
MIEAGTQEKVRRKIPTGGKDAAVAGRKPRRPSSSKTVLAGGLSRTASGSIQRWSEPSVDLRRVLSLLTVFRDHFETTIEQQYTTNCF